MRKRFGQYFLRSRAAQRVVAGALHVSHETPVLEIGPGKGALTACILERYDSVVAIEKDPTLIPILHERFADAVSTDSLTILEGDVRDGEWRTVIDGSPYVVIANIPFYLTGSLIRELLTAAHPPVALSLVVQKEVAERITKRKDGKESLLSLSVRLFGTASYIKTVPRRAFSPQPAVDSAIITVTDIRQPSRHIQDAFFTIIRTAFREKRKSVLKKFNAVPILRDTLARNGVSSTDRAEDVPFDVWFAAACVVA